ncbi:DHA2 family multidrug resistance protein-like MFS transporter [Haloactinospora alba]|uniref:DHA2 family multidrug resistance protein-like MFS transporter n=1 Tax=Haloactinospora alba TaxID=405555 RepID=A0A543NAF1_9ACTN|nr:MFS transporter [Haloactinospora alba]TQN28795.1 DHA2 family multidrug resistance protein-like MFS transporter [Haloactinospora alba]
MNTAHHHDPLTRPWRGLTLLLLPTAVVAVDLNVLFLALPELTTDLRVNAAEQLWITDVYGLVVGVLAVVAGAVGDRFGRRRLLFLGSTGFLLASLLAAFAPSSTALIAARVLQAVAGATLMPSTLALITELFPEESKRGRAIAAWATTQFAFASFGPVIGGIMLHQWWWGSVFLLAVPVSLAVLTLGPRLLPEHVDPASAQHVDGLSAGLLVAALACTFLLIKTGLPAHGSPVTMAVAAGAGALVIGAWFVRRQLTTASPLLDLRILATPAVASTLTALILAGVVLAGTGFWATQYLQSDAGLTPLAAAVAFVPMGIGVAVGTQIAARLSPTIPADILIPAGLAVSAGSEALLVLVGESHPLLPLVLSYTLTGLGCGPLFAFGTHRLVSAAPPESAARAAALAETGNHVGSAAGIALLGTIGRVASEGIAAGSGTLTGSLHIVGSVSAGILLFCACLAARATLTARRRERTISR